MTYSLLFLVFCKVWLVIYVSMAKSHQGHFNRPICWHGNLFLFIFRIMLGNENVPKLNIGGMTSTSNVDKEIAIYFMMLNNPLWLTLGASPFWALFLLHVPKIIKGLIRWSYELDFTLSASFTKHISFCQVLKRNW